ncbi:hypothetical protein ACF1A5_33015 [Streptomyces sp. NPDC014864]|uniref:hypothetical protein n=1 Tax=Streptomyces sp. NPDC014864 TaxID=3364924 RepID=UPI00370216AA
MIDDSHRINGTVNVRATVPAKAWCATPIGQVQVGGPAGQYSDGVSLRLGLQALFENVVGGRGTLRRRRAGAADGNCHNRRLTAPSDLARACPLLTLPTAYLLGGVTLIQLGWDELDFAPYANIDGRGGGRYLGVVKRRSAGREI